MSRVFKSPSTGAGVYVFSDDHCPPHVHARQRSDGWIARVRFSFVENDLQLLSIAPSRNSPLQRTINQLLDDVEAELPACRQIWWAIRQTTCLANQWALASAAGRIELLSEATPNAKQIAKAIYNPNTRQTLVRFRDGTTLDASIRS